VNERFIESPLFPVDVVSEASAREKEGGGRPDYWEMVFWWTRKPLAGARAVVAGAALPATVEPYRFNLMLRLTPDRMLGGPKTAHRLNPAIPEGLRGYFRGRKLLDPFAGFGSIPLEAVRLGMGEVVAVEFLPTAYVFLKAVLEYPKWVAERGVSEKLKEDVRRWGEWVAEELRGGPDIQELYDGGVAVYIGTWEVVCPTCRRYTPLVGNWWLARVKGDRGYRRLAWMKPVTSGGRVGVEVADLNRIHGSVAGAKLKAGKKQIAGREVESYTVEIAGREYSVPEPNVVADADYASCLLCGNTMIDREAVAELRKHVESEARKLTRVPVRFTDTFYERLLVEGVETAFRELKERADRGEKDQDATTYRFLRDSRKLTAFKDLIRKTLKELGEEHTAFYPKKTIRDWNRKLEDYLNGRATLEDLKNAMARPRLLVKVKVENGDLEFEPATEDDNEKLWKALEKLKAMWGDPDVPKEPIPEYESRSIWVIAYGFSKWYQLFNPRQLLTLVKLVKLVREAGKKVEEEKLREGWSREDAFKYAEAVTTYLATALVNHIRHSCLTTSVEPTQKFIAHALAFRGIAMTWNWIEERSTVDMIGSFVKSMNSISEGLSYLVSAVSGSPSRVRVLLDDATSLSKLGGEKFDLIVTDPPYRDDVPYAELSDFYFVWLKRALSDAVDGRLAPRFHGDAFFNNGREIEVQWREYAVAEISYNDGRARYFGLSSGLDHYKRLMALAFITMSERLKDEGILVTYFAHTSPDAWAELIEAGWKHGGFVVTAGFPLATESTQSVVKRGKLSLDTSIVVVWRKAIGGRPATSMESVSEEMFREGVRWAEKVLGRLYGRDLFFSVLVKVLSIATRYSSLYDSRGEVEVRRLVDEYVVPITARALVAAAGGEAEEIALDKIALFYLVTKILYHVSGGVTVREKILSDDDVVLLTLATRVDRDDLLNYGIIVKSDKEEYRFMEPPYKGVKEFGKKEFEEFLEFLESRGVNPVKLEVVERNACSIDVLHLMEYATLFTGDPRRYFEELKKAYPALYDTAVKLVELLVRALPGDPESSACRKVLYYIGGG
jgi:putative DNA methylase